MSKKAEEDCWMYNKDGAKLFKSGETIPAGYVDTPAKLKKSKADKQD